MKLSARDLNEDTIESLVITWDLFIKIRDYTEKKYLNTSYYDHSHGVMRTYTLNYCLQTNYFQEPEKYIIKRGGSAPSKYSGKLNGIERLKADTPSFESIYRNIARKYPNEVKFVNRRVVIPHTDSSESEPNIPF